MQTLLLLWMVGTLLGNCHWDGIDVSYTDEHTEDLLSQHEHEIARLKVEVRLKTPTLASIKKYLDICEEEKELEQAAGDQTRLLGRGRDPGRLLREEKMRKRVGKEKPKVRCQVPQLFRYILNRSTCSWSNNCFRPCLRGSRRMVAPSWCMGKVCSRF